MIERVCRRPIVRLACFAALVWNPDARAQQTFASTLPAADALDDPSIGRRLLAGVRDDVPSFDDPAFYWYCRHVRRNAQSADLRVTPTDKPMDWKRLLESPGAFRGQIVIIDGILRARQSYEVSNRRDVGTLHQFEVKLPAGPLCAVISPVVDAPCPLGRPVRVKGYFVKNRSYQTKGAAASTGPLIVVPGLEAIDIGVPGGESRMTYMRWVIGGTAMLAVVWLVLRRTMSPQRHPRSVLRGQGSSHGDFQWLLDSSPRDLPPQ